jgi:phosphotransferase system HPr (HPr) family protein
VLKESIKIEIENGLHARPAMRLISSLKDLNAKVTVGYEDKRANLSSVLELLLLMAPCGQILSVEAEGPDEGRAIEAVKNILTTKNL